MSENTRQLNQEKPSNIWLLPIAVVISIVPLIVLLKADVLSEQMKEWSGLAYYADFFNYYKSQWLTIATMIGFAFFLFYLFVHGFKFKASPKGSSLYIPAIIYAILIVVSTLKSQYPDIAERGFMDRYEGMWVLLCYLTLLIITYNMINHEKQIKFLFAALLVSASIIATIGILQFAGFDIFRTDVGKQAILPEKFREFAGNMEFRFEKSRIYSTFSNPNYIGSYTAMIIPIAFTAIIYSKKIYLKLAAAILTIVLMINLFGSSSRAGLVGLTAATIIGLFLYRRAIFKKKWIALAAIAISIALIFGANAATDGAIFTKLKSEIKRAMAGAPLTSLQDIVFKDNTVTIVNEKETLVIEKGEDNLIQYYDKDHNLLETKETSSNNRLNVTFKDPAINESFSKVTVAGRYITVAATYTGDAANTGRYANIELYTMEDNTFCYIGALSDITNNIEKAEQIGFKDKETLGSSRGYIWSRTLPLLKNTVIWGTGPDTYALVFPQRDYIGKLRAFGEGPKMVVDKPHNAYLQVAVNTGVLSLVAYIALLLMYVISSLITYIRLGSVETEENRSLYIKGTGIFIAVCGYSTAAFFNDTVVGIAPIFWVLLGIGFVCNKMIKDYQQVSA